MDRRTSLAASITVTATLAFGAVAFAALGGAGLFAGDTSADSAASTSPVIVTQPAGPLDTSATVPAESTAPGTPTVTIAQSNGGSRPAGGGSNTPAAGTTGASTAGTTGTTAGGATTTTTKSTVAPTTSAAPTTTAAAATTTTVKAQLYSITGVPVPAGFKVPSKWIAKGIPDWPVGCKKGQLEDNGVWNCE